VRPSRQPPSSLAPAARSGSPVDWRAATPQFVAIGWDDNGFSGLPGSGGTGGLSWALDLAQSRGAQMSFYLTSCHACSDEGEQVQRAWRRILEDGHEVGNHSVSHPDGSAFDQRTWRDELAECNRQLAALGLGVPTGFRTPYLRYNDAALAAVSELGFAYDCSIEEGFQPDQDGSDFLWPYLLDAGSPGHEVEVARGERAPLTPHVGLWEMPAYAVIVPADEACARYGVAPGLRARCAARQPYFDARDGKITGFDYNLWVCFGMSRAEFVATLCHTLDLRLAGNRAPFLFGGHTDYYSSKYAGEPMPGATLDERQAAVAEFLDYALARPEVRAVSTASVLSWIRNHPQA
jgi:peptidoglycan/xylan/chitin deacetylase (PgdA/CDA1 family)